MPIPRFIMAFSVSITIFIVGFGTVGSSLSLAGSPSQEKMPPLAHRDHSQLSADDLQAEGKNHRCGGGFGPTSRGKIASTR